MQNKKKSKNSKKISEKLESSFEKLVKPEIISRNIVIFLILMIFLGMILDFIYIY